MVLKFGVCLLTILMVRANAPADGALLETLVGQETKLIEAIGNKDNAEIDELLAVEAYSITASRGRRTTKEVIDDLKHVTFTSYKISDPAAIPVSEDVAILTYTFSYTVEGSSTDVTVYATSIWKKTNGAWDSVFYQETPVKE